MHVFSKDITKRLDDTPLQKQLGLSHFFRRNDLIKIFKRPTMYNRLNTTYSGM